MNVLGSVGQLYMFILLVLLFLGSGLAVWRFVNFLMERGIVKQGETVISKQNGQIYKTRNEEHKVKGGHIMANNGWIKLAVFSFVGVIVSVAVLGLVSTNNPQGMNMGVQGTSIHQQHQQQGMPQNGMGNMNMQGGMNVNTSTGNMQMQGGMNQDQMMMMQQLNQMQMQLNQMQQQMGMMNGGMSNMQQGGNMSNMPQNSGSMGGMGMMNMMGGMGMMGGMSGGSGSMNSMPQNNANSGSMSNMPQNGGSSGGSMGGMSMM